MTGGVTRFWDAASGPDDDDRTWVDAVVVQVNADGTVDLAYQGSTVSAVVLAGYVPRTGDVVVALRQNPRRAGRLLVIGPIRTDSPTTVNVGSQLVVAADVSAKPAPPPTGSTGDTVTGTSTFAATGVRSWRSLDGWSRADAYQGAFSGRLGYWRGLYFYGSDPQTLKGRRVTAASIRLNRLDTDGVVAPEPCYLSRHVHASQPGGAPLFTGSRTTVGSLGRGAIGTFDLPLAWVQDLVDGRIRGFGHALDSTADYAIFASLAADSLSGRLTISWTTD